MNQRIGARAGATRECHVTDVPDHHGLVGRVRRRGHYVNQSHGVEQSRKEWAHRRANPAGRARDDNGPGRCHATRLALAPVLRTARPLRRTAPIHSQLDDT